MADLSTTSIVTSTVDADGTVFYLSNSSIYRWQAGQTDIVIPASNLASPVTELAAAGRGGFAYRLEGNTSGAPQQIRLWRGGHDTLVAEPDMPVPGHSGFWFTAVRYAYASSSGNIAFNATVSNPQTGETQAGQFVSVNGVLRTAFMTGDSLPSGAVITQVDYTGSMGPDGAVYAELRYADGVDIGAGIYRSAGGAVELVVASGQTLTSGESFNYSGPVRTGHMSSNGTVLLEAFDGTWGLFLARRGVVRPLIYQHAILAAGELTNWGHFTMGMVSDCQAVYVAYTTTSTALATTSDNGATSLLVRPGDTAPNGDTITGTNQAPTNFMGGTVAGKYALVTVESSTGSYLMRAEVPQLPCGQPPLTALILTSFGGETASAKTAIRLIELAADSSVRQSCQARLQAFNGHINRAVTRGEIGPSAGAEIIQLASSTCG